MKWRTSPLAPKVELNSLEKSVKPQTESCARQKWCLFYLSNCVAKKGKIQEDRVKEQETA